MVERQPGDAADAPTAYAGLQLVDPVPPHPLLEREDLAQAAEPVGARRSADVGAGDVLCHPAAVHLLETDPPGDAQSRFDLELPKEPLEEVEPEGDVGVQLDDHVRGSDVLEAPVKGPDDRSAPGHLALRLELLQADPVVSADKVGGNDGRQVVRAAVDDDPDYR